MPGTRATVMWLGREADAPLRTPRSRQSPFCRDESRPDKSGCRSRKQAAGRTRTPASCSRLLPTFFWCPRKDLNLQPLVCRTSAPSVELLGRMSPKSKCPMSKSICTSLTLDFGHWTLDGGFWRSELESNQPLGFFRPALIRLSYPTGDWS